MGDLSSNCFQVCSRCQSDMNVLHHGIHVSIHLIVSHKFVEDDFGSCARQPGQLVNDQSSDRGKCDSFRVLVDVRQQVWSCDNSDATAGDWK